MTCPYKYQHLFQLHDRHSVHNHNDHVQSKPTKIDCSKIFVLSGAFSIFRFKQPQPKLKQTKRNIVTPPSYGDTLEKIKKSVSQAILLGRFE